MRFVPQRSPARLLSFLPGFEVGAEGEPVIDDIGPGLLECQGKAVEQGSKLSSVGGIGRCLLPRVLCALQEERARLLQRDALDLALPETGRPRREPRGHKDLPALEARKELPDRPGRVLRVHIVENEEPAGVLPQPGENGAEDLLLGGSLPLRQPEQVRACQRGDLRAEPGRRVGADEEGGAVQVPVAPGVLDREARFADAAEAMKNLLLRGRRGERFQRRQLRLSSFEEIAQGLEGEVVKRGRREPGRRLGGGLLAGDAEDEPVDPLPGDAVSEIDPGPEAEKGGNLGLAGRSGKEDRDHGERAFHGLHEADAHLGSLPGAHTVGAHEHGGRGDGGEDGLDRFLPIPAGDQLLFVQPGPQLPLLETLVDLPDKRLVPAVVAEEDVERRFHRGAGSSCEGMLASLSARAEGGSSGVLAAQGSVKVAGKGASGARKMQSRGRGPAPKGLGLVAWGESPRLG
jgi:hypothetical protein